MAVFNSFVNSASYILNLMEIDYSRSRNTGYIVTFLNSHRVA